MEWIVSTDPARIQFDVVYGWLRETYWSPNVRREVSRKAFANSLAAGAYDHDGRQLGVARVASDRATFAWLCDVYVDEAARGRGIGRAMVKALMEHPELQTVRRWCLGTRDAHEVYRPLGFDTGNSKVLMEHLPDPARWQEPR
jgi:GNAT superfamily N-acetyltransferase